MSFAPLAQPTAENMDVKKITALNGKLEGKFLNYKNISDEIYTKASTIAENIDTREATVIPFRRNAICLASLLAIACIRGAQIS